MMERNIFTKQFNELTADELLHLMDMISEECDSKRQCEGCNLFECCGVHNAVPSEWYTNAIKKIVDEFREENR